MDEQETAAQQGAETANAETAEPVAAAKTPRPIGEVAPNEIFPDAERVDKSTLTGAALIINAAKLLSGEHGEYVVFQFTRQGEEKLYSTSTGASAVVDKLSQVIEQEAFPVSATVDTSKGYMNLV